MKPVRHTTDRFLAPPENWDEKRHGPCTGLPVKLENGVWTSYWEPSAEEREALARGEPIRVEVFSNSHPPIAINVGDNKS